MLTHHEITLFILSVAILLALARFLGELAVRLHQPAVLGELLAGIILGPTVLGALAPGVGAALFPRVGNLAVGRECLTTLAISLFLLVAGMEVELSTIFRRGRAALYVSAAGIVVPFAIGFACAWGFPERLDAGINADRLIFALFFATALAITALPVIAKILMDLHLFQSDLGMVVIAAAIFDDLTGWIIFAIILAMIGPHGAGASAPLLTILLTLGFTVVMLTLGRWLLDRAIPWVQAYTSWPGGILGFALALALACAAFTEWIGIHAVFGAFIFGVALGDSRHLREQTRATLEQFIGFIFAPLFFAGVGLKVNFIQNFDPGLFLVVLLIATLGKVLGCGGGARLAGMPPREAWAVGFAMNARGAMEMILGLLALQAGLIGEQMFVALVLMALVTSMAAGTLAQRILRRPKPARLENFLGPKNFHRSMAASDRQGVIAELCQALCADAGRDPSPVMDQVWEREQVFSTSLGHGVAVPHARIEGLKQPLLAVGISEIGVDFDAPDGRPAHVLFLLLTPPDQTTVQLELLAEIGGLFADRELTDAALKAGDFTQFLSLIKSWPLRGKRKA